MVKIIYDVLITHYIESIIFIILSILLFFGLYKFFYFLRYGNILIDDISNEKKYKHEIDILKDESEQKQSSLSELTKAVKESNERIRRSELEYKSIFDNANIGIVRLSYEQRIIILNNKNFIRLWGFNSQTEFQRFYMKREKDLFDDSKEWLSYIDNLENMDGENFDIAIKTLSTDIKYIRITSNSVKDDLANILFFDLFIQDVTLEKELTNKLRSYNDELKTEVEKKTKELKDMYADYKHIFENSPIGIFRTHALTGENIKANKYLANLMGFDTVEECLKHNIKEFYQDKDRQQFVSSQHMKKIGDIVTYEVMLTNNQGKKIYTLQSEVYDEVNQFYEGVILDITDKYEAEKKLRESEERWRNLYNNSIAGMVRTDFDGNPIEVNDVFVEMLRYKNKEEYFEKYNSYKHYVDPLVRRKIIDEILTYFQQNPNENTYVTKHAVQLKTTTDQVIHASLSMLADRKCKYLDTVVVDITDEHQILENYRLLSNTLEEKVNDKTLELKKEKELLIFKDNLLRIINKTASIYLEGQNWREHVYSFFNDMAMILNIDRIYIYENKYDTHSKKVYNNLLAQWVKKPVFTLENTMDTQSWDNHPIKDVLSVLLQGEHLCIQDTDYTDDDTLKFFRNINLKSALVFPLTLSNNEYWGCIGFDTCTQYRLWTEEEINILKIASTLINSAIFREINDIEKSYEFNNIINILNNIPACISIREFPDHRYTYVNKLFEEKVNMSDIIGKTIVDIYGEEVASKKIAEDQFFVTDHQIRSFIENVNDTWFVTTVMPYKEDRDTILGVITTSIDITQSKMKEMELQEEIKIYQDIVENTNDIITVTDKNETIIYANTSAKKIVECDPIGKNIKEFVTGNFYTNTLSDKLLDRSKTHNSETYLYELLDSNNKLHNLLITANTRLDKHGNYNGTYNISTDITDIINMQKDLMNKENTIKALMNTTPIPIAFIKEGKITFANKEFCLLFFGKMVCDKDFENRDFIDMIIPPSERDQIRKNYTNQCHAAKEGQNMLIDSYDSLIIQKNSTTILCDVNMSSILLSDGIYTIVSIVDKSDHYHLLRKIQDEKNLLNNILDNIPDQIFVRDRDLNFVLSNKSDKLALGINPDDDIVGKNDFDFYPEYLANEYRKDNLHVISSGKSIINKEEINNGRNILVTKVPFIKDDKIIGIIGISKDITQFKNIVKELEIYKNIVENTSAIITMVDKDENFTYSNHMANLSHKVKNLVGMNSKSFISPEYARYIQKYEIEENRMKGKSSIYDYVYLDSEQNEHVLFLSSTSIMDGDVYDGSINISFDITGMKGLKKRLKRLRKKSKG